MIQVQLTVTVMATELMIQVYYLHCICKARFTKHEYFQIVRFLFKHWLNCQRFEIISKVFHRWMSLKGGRPIWRGTLRSKEKWTESASFSKQHWKRHLYGRFNLLNYRCIYSTFSMCTSQVDSLFMKILLHIYDYDFISLNTHYMLWMSSWSYWAKYLRDIIKPCQRVIYIVQRELAMKITF